MSIYKTLMQGLLLTFVLPASIQANAVTSAETELQAKRQSIPQEGKEYITLIHPVASQPKVVEFFHFIAALATNLLRIIRSPTPLIVFYPRAKPSPNIMSA